MINTSAIKNDLVLSFGTKVCFVVFFRGEPWSVGELCE